MSADQNQVFDTTMKFGEMGFVTKFVFLGQLAIAMMTFGFAFPHVLD